MALPLFLTFLFPLGIYLLILASINRRERPLMVAGVWDGIGLALGLSGILLGLGPVLLGTLYERGLVPGADSSGRNFADVWTLYPWIWTAYYVCVLVGQALMIVSRRNKTSVYNCDGAGIENLLIACIEHRDFGITSTELGVFIFEPKAQGPPSLGFPGGAVQIEHFTATRHATLHWFVKQESTRRILEADLNVRLDEAIAETNPTASWLLGASGFLFAIVFLGAALSILTSIVPHR